MAWYDGFSYVDHRTAVNGEDVSQQKLNKILMVSGADDGAVLVRGFGSRQPWEMSSF